MIVGLLLVTALTMAAFGLPWNGSEPEKDAAGETIMTVARGDIRQVVETTGRVVSNLDVEIKCKASGEIVSLPFDISDPVRKDELLLELDPVDEKRSVQQAEVQLSASQARMVQAEQNLKIAEARLATGKKRVEATLKAAAAHARDSMARSERLKTLLDKDLTSREEYDSSQASAIQAEAELEKARVSLEELKIEEMGLELERQDVELAGTQVLLNEIALEQARQVLEDTKVVAPIDGVVVKRTVQTGQIISSGISNVGGGTAVLTLSDLSRLFVKASVDESDIGTIAVGQAALITIDAFPDQQFRGDVVRVATQGENVSNVVTFEVKIEVQGRNKTLLKPAMTANCEIIVSEAADTLLVPSEAISHQRENCFVTVKKEDGTTEKHQVTVGTDDGLNMQIIAGVQEGDQLVVTEGEGENTWSRTVPKPGMGMMMGEGRRGL